MADTRKPSMRGFFDRRDNVSRAARALRAARDPHQVPFAVWQDMMNDPALLAPLARLLDANLDDPAAIEVADVILRHTEARRG